VQKGSQAKQFKPIAGRSLPTRALVSIE